MVKKKFGVPPMTFSEKVVKVACSIPKGKVMTYGGIARACGAGPLASRSITAILAKAYEQGEKRIPFHRIVYANGRVWLNSEYEVKRRRLYKKEGIVIDARGRIQDFEAHIFDPRNSKNH